MLPDAAIMFESLPEIIPEGELPSLARMQRAKGIGITQAEHDAIQGTRLWLKQSVMNPR